MKIKDAGAGRFNSRRTAKYLNPDIPEGNQGFNLAGNRIAQRRHLLALFAPLFFDLTFLIVVS